MAKNPIIFACANPNPEIIPPVAKRRQGDDVQLFGNLGSK